MQSDPQHAHLMTLFETAVKSAHPDVCLPAFLPDLDISEDMLVLGAGKATAAMVCAVEKHYRKQGLANKIKGLAVTRHGYTLPTDFIELVEAGHPVPDTAGSDAAQKSLNLATEAGPKDIVLVLISGGASALWTLPVEGVSLAEKQQLTRTLLASGARITEINCVRRHLSKIKGGRLVAAAQNCQSLLTLAISDVPGDDPASIGSGPTVGDLSTLEEAREIIKAYDISLTPALKKALRNTDNETPSPDDPLFAHTTYKLIATPAMSLEAAAAEAGRLGYEPILLGSDLEGEARDLAKHHATLALKARGKGQRLVLMSGGEVTVTIRGNGRGGPNQEYALALALALDGADGIWAIACDTDGADGGQGLADDPAGATINSTTLKRAKSLDLNAVNFLKNNDSGGFFAALDDLVTPGPTQTNVNDFRAILIDP